MCGYDALEQFRLAFDGGHTPVRELWKLQGLIRVWYVGKKLILLLGLIPFYWINDVKLCGLLWCTIMWEQIWGSIIIVEPDGIPFAAFIIVWDQLRLIIS